MADMTGKKVSSGKRTLCVIGFICNIDSLLKLSKELLLGPAPVQRYLLTYKLSQDHLELFFPAVRQRVGWNNNPSAVQFSNVFRSLLSHSSITGSAKANCVSQDTTALLNVVDTEPDDDIVSFINFESALSDHPYSCTNTGLSVFVEGIIVYIAGWVLRSVTKQVSCKECSLALISPASECTSGVICMSPD